ncbi:MAG: DUF1574 domain-containing protein [Leptospiraceae bacterium]|nr:DUF1574 domain-containing protein [Leptospiraceae bacterium]MCP5496554.1 DUF1574 domain-containing protein [Leptospiraceae bacterium]
MLKHKFLLLPFVIFIIAFLLDKFFMIESIHVYYSKTLSEINYFHKPELFDEMKKYLSQKDRKKVFVYFGNSRALLFSNEYIAQEYPEWILYNFSVPGGTPDYALYWLEQFESEGVHPDFVLIDASIEVFNQTPVIKLDEVLLNGVDFSFVFRYWNRYSPNDRNNFIAKRLFRLYQYRPKFNIILSRLKDDGRFVRIFENFRKEVRQKLKKERGSATSEMKASHTSSKEFIRNNAEFTYLSYITPYTFSDSMLAFLQDDILILQKMKVPHAVILVRIAPPYYNIIKTKKIHENPEDTTTVYDIWYAKVGKSLEQTSTPLFNMNEDGDYDCDDFSDASHMSTTCYPAYTDYIFKNIQKQLGQ